MSFNVKMDRDPQYTYHITSSKFTGSEIHSVNQTNDAMAEFIHRLTTKYQPMIEQEINQTVNQPNNQTINKSAQQLLIEKLRAQSYAVITPPPRRRIRAYIDGCYDLLHSGHYNAIRQAASLADELVLGIHTDLEIAHHKGPPVMNDIERVAGVKSCKWIDLVVHGVPYDPSIELLDHLGCDFAVHGDDPSFTANGDDAFAAVKAAGRMKIVKRTEGISTTDLVRRLLRVAKAESSKDEIEEKFDAPLNGHTVKPPFTPTLSSFLPVSFRFSQFCNNRTPSSKDRCVLVLGDWDLFHAGHISMLEECKALGTFLYVGVLADHAVTARAGSQSYPIMAVAERALNVLACRCVDEIILGAEDKLTADMITTLNISIVVRPNEEMNPKFDELYAAANKLGMVHCLPSKEDALTTRKVVDRILNNQEKYEKRNSKRSVKETEYFTKKEYVEEMSNAKNY